MDEEFPHYLSEVRSILFAIRNQQLHQFARAFSPIDEYPPFEMA
jgi:hypothetical protein